MWKWTWWKDFSVTVNAQAKLIEALVLVRAFIISRKCRVNEACSKYKQFYCYIDTEGHPRPTVVNNAAVDVEGPTGKTRHILSSSSQQFSSQFHEKDVQRFDGFLTTAPCQAKLHPNTNYEFLEITSVSRFTAVRFTTWTSGCTTQSVGTKVFGGGICFATLCRRLSGWRVGEGRLKSKYSLVMWQPSVPLHTLQPLGFWVCSLQPLRRTCSAMNNAIKVSKSKTEGYLFDRAPSFHQWQACFQQRRKGGMSTTDSGSLGSAKLQQSFRKQKTNLQIQGSIHCFIGQFFCSLKKKMWWAHPVQAKKCPNVSTTCHVTFCEVSFCKVWFSKGSN